MTAALTSDPIASIYRQHHGWLHAWLRRRTGCSEGAADLAHDTFVRLLRRPQACDLEQPRALLTHIAKGLLVDHWRRRDLEQAYQAALASLPEPLTPAPEERLAILETLYQIDAMLRLLPARTRNIFLRAQLDGLSYPQVAAATGTSLATVKRHMRDGYLACLQALED